MYLRASPARSSFMSWPSLFTLLSFNLWRKAARLFSSRNPSQSILLGLKKPQHLGNVANYSFRNLVLWRITSWACQEFIKVIKQSSLVPLKVPR